MIDNLRLSLEHGVVQLGLNLSEKSIIQLLDYLLFLHKWNQTYNITGHHSLEEMLSLHLLDSLAIVKPLNIYIHNNLTNLRAELSLLDVGSGAGLPGIVLAVCLPHLKIVCLDSVSKKTAFLQQVKSKLFLSNLSIVHARIESHREIYQMITSRAFSSLKQFTQLTSHCLDDNGSWLAMKGKLPSDEISDLDKSIEVFHVEQLQVPDIQANRCLVYLRKKWNDKQSCNLN